MRSLKVFALAMLCCVLSLATQVTLFAANSPTVSDDGVAIVDPAKAGPIFALQGEYSGTLAGTPWGAQVIALSDSEVAVVGYEGGLPGQGWKRGNETQTGKGKLVGSVLEVSGEGWRGEIGDSEFTVIDGSNSELGTLKKVERTSPTMGAKPPANAIVLFDGSSADQFENGKLMDGLLAATNCTSKATFGDHTLHLEFRTPFMPAARGQGRGNSGCYIQGRYECQILDSFGLDGKDNECGGIYSIHEPIVNMCFPPLNWQTYDIEFQQAKYNDKGEKTASARVTIKHNGVVIHDRLELTHGTPGHHAEGPGPDHLFLQDHGNPVMFRNIWVVRNDK